MHKWNTNWLGGDRRGRNIRPYDLKYFLSRSRHAYSDPLYYYAPSAGRHTFLNYTHTIHFTLYFAPYTLPYTPLNCVTHEKALLVLYCTLPSPPFKIRPAETSQGVNRFVSWRQMWLRLESTETLILKTLKSVWSFLSSCIVILVKIIIDWNIHPEPPFHQLIQQSTPSHASHPTAATFSRTKLNQSYQCLYCLFNFQFSPTPILQSIPSRANHPTVETSSQTKLNQIEPTFVPTL